jgi:hypothetical protein
LRFIGWLEKMVQPKQKERFTNAEVALEALKPLDVIRVPGVDFSETVLELKANRLGEKLTRVIIIENSINDDFVFSSGVSTNMLELSEKFFKLHNLNFYDYIDYNDDMNYPNEYNLIGDNTKLKSIGWEPKHDINYLITDMVNNEII